jgi:hypothetical protein
MEVTEKAVMERWGRSPLKGKGEEGEVSSVAFCLVGSGEQGGEGANRLGAKGGDCGGLV